MDQKGFSLVEALLALAIMGIVSFGMATLLSNQAREIKYLELKHEALSIKNQIENALSQSSSCSWQLLDKRFDARGVTATRPSEDIINFTGNTIYGGPEPEKYKVIQKDDQIVPGMTAKKLYVKNILRLSPDTYSGEVTVDFEAKEAARMIKPISKKIQIATDPASPLNAKKIVSCYQDGGSGIAEKCVVRTRTSSGDAEHIQCCNANEAVIAFAAPSDPKDAALGWRDERCITAGDIKAGNPIQLRCCR